MHYWWWIGKTTDQYAEEKRWVFSFDLKEESEDECLTERGREFQSTGPVYWKDLTHSVLLPVCQCFHLCATIFILKTYFSASILSSSRYVRVDSLFTNQEQRIQSWRVWYFYHALPLCSWRHLPQTAWHKMAALTVVVFSRLSNVDLSQTGRRIE